MAGSYGHCCKEEDGSFIGDEFTDMIENLGDAYEACEMMHWMIDYLAYRHSKSTNGAAILIEEAQQAYYIARRTSVKKG